MLTQYSNTLAKLNIILGSQSPRRQQIFKENLGLSKFHIIVSKFEENLPKTNPIDYVKKTSWMKAMDIISDQNNFIDDILPHIIITADTIVVQNNEILEKPTKENCFLMLSKLSDNSHDVITAVTIATLKLKHERPIDTTDRCNSYDVATFTESTRVKFIELSNEMIQSYMKTEEPFDKAGGYGIQSLGSSFVKGIEGCYFNVMGFPVHRFCVEVIPYLMKIENEESYF